MQEIYNLIYNFVNTVAAEYQHIQYTAQLFKYSYIALWVVVLISFFLIIAINAKLSRIESKLIRIIENDRNLIETYNNPGPFDR